MTLPTPSPHMLGTKRVLQPPQTKGGAEVTAGLSCCSLSPTGSKMKREPRGPAVAGLAEGLRCCPGHRAVQEEFRKCISVKICCCPTTGVPARAQGATSAQKHPYKACTAHPRGGEKCHISPPWALQPLFPSGWARGHGDRGDTDVKSSWHPSASSCSLQGSSWCCGAHPAHRACRLCLGTLGCEIREVFSLSPTLLP